MYGSFLPAPPPNVHRLMISNFSWSVPKDFPQILRGIMQEGEYADYLKRIEEALKFSKLFMFSPFIPFVLFAIGAALIGITGKIYFIAIIIIGFFAFIITSFSMVFLFAHKMKKALGKLQVVLDEINTRYYSRGVKWTYNSMYIRRNSQIQFIDIITFTPGAPDAPQMANPMIIGEQYTMTPTAPSYPAPPQQQQQQYQPPPKDTLYGYGANPSVASGDVDGPNPYASYPTAPAPDTYPGNPYGY